MWYLTIKAEKRRENPDKSHLIYLRETLPLEISGTGFLTRNSKRINVTKEKENLTSNVLKVYNGTQTATQRNFTLPR